MLDLYVSTRIRLTTLMAKLTDDRGSDVTEKAGMIALAAALAALVALAAKAFVESKIGTWH